LKRLLAKRKRKKDLGLQLTGVSEEAGRNEEVGKNKKI